MPPKKVKVTKPSAAHKKKFVLPGAGVLLGVTKMQKGSREKRKSTAPSTSGTGTPSSAGIFGTTDTDDSTTSQASSLATVALLKTKTKRFRKSQFQTVGKPSAQIPSLPKPSSLTLIQSIPKPSEAELEFMGYVAAGYYNDAENFLEHLDPTKDFDINKPNSSGYTALHIAVDRQDEAMITLLLSLPGIEISDTFFYAIKEGGRDIVKLFIEFEMDKYFKSSLSHRSLTQEEIGEKKKNKLKDILAKLTMAKNETVNSEFSGDITPLMLAAQCGHYELIKYFFEAGDKIEEVEDLDSKETAEDLLVTYNRLHKFQAISNPVYISFFALEFYSVDPIFQAFNLLTQLKYFAQMEPEVGNEYLELVETLEEYCAELLALCRDDEEVEILLKQREGYQTSSASEEIYPRLMLAIQKNQVKFVTHANAQMKLYEQWIQGYEDWYTYSSWEKVWGVLYRIIFCPIICLILCFSSDCCCKNSSFIPSWKAPISRFILTSGMYGWFLILLFLEVFAEDIFHDEFDVELRQAPSLSNARAVLDLLIFIFVVGHTIASLKRFSFMPARFFQSQWNIFELVTNVFFLTAFVAWIHAWFLHPSKGGIIRALWPKYDPLLMGEGCFAIAIVMSYLRGFRFLMIHPKLGPLLRAFGNMQKEIEKVLILFLVLIISFGLGMCMLYKGYADYTYIDPVTGEEIEQPNGFTTLSSSLETLFYGFFGGSDVENTHLVDMHVEHRNGTITHHHTLIEVTGKTIFALFVVCGNIILVNTTVTLMTNSAGQVFDDIDASWKFARAEVWTYYGRGSMIVPSPFNIIAMFKTRLLCKLLGIGKTNYEIGWSWTRCIYLDEKNPDSDKRLKTDYSILIKDLVQRYFRKKATISARDTATMDQVNKLREYVAQMKERCKVKV